MPYAPSDPPVLTLTTGPVDAYPAVLRGLAAPVLYDYDPAFQATYERVCRKLGEIVKSETVPVLLQGEPVLALEAAAASAIGAKDVVLNLVAGVYAKGFEGWAARSGAEIVELAVPYDEVIDPAMVEAALKARPDVTVVALCHHDTPSGTINPVAEIGAIVARHGALFLVDAVSSFGGMPVDAASAHADIFVTGPNKCLGCPPALSIVGVSAKAWAKMKANPAAPRDSILSILDWEDAWRADRPFPFTPSVAEINGLEAAVDHFLAEGAERVFARHAATARACRAGIRAMGLELWAKDERFASPTATAVRTPDGVDEAALRAAVRARYGVVLSSGRGATLGRLTRIGHMGPTAQPIHAVTAVAAFGGTLAAFGRPVDVGAGVAAALASIDAG
ncbi:pyridoxamine--pyruvate transaminase [Oharaeibacter diazotrophicus]|uniref:Pyridoxamine--pyruvate transaminase n=2 Tax=Oharaeibacter diazotrophicus TaxID=1920512 RepID=A0A4R6R7G7_9HYPH|nr:alanine--glyoxylate aminotransferase family protein [Oharaeibacter diazotrophicus]TDP81913.1 pyridoxamine--pyruvate transaminase [Oharaeibacter diazotrophicus]BBE73545.1 purine catabolism protein PucG [Pleomorphomonas sp. SM30]GLS75335.1 aminotransferase [Oharaeibacter diazotrophicus]